IPKNLHFRTLNPRVRLEETALELANEPRAWPRTNAPRFAAVSSFGLSGTNAHAVLEEAPVTPERAPSSERVAEVVVVSAKTAPPLAARADDLAKHVRAHAGVALADLAFSSATGRTAMDHRMAVAVASHDALAAALECAARGEAVDGLVRGTT